MTREVIVSRQARREIAGATAWGAENRSRSEAGRWAIEIEDALDGLADDPERHPLCDEAECFGLAVRQLNFGLGRRASHRILFEVRDERVVILRVRHVAQDSLSAEDFDD